MQTQVRVTERQNQTFITGIRDQTTVGYKYFRFAGDELLALELRGHFSGNILISHDEAGDESIDGYELRLASDEWGLHLIPISPAKEKQALYFHFAGESELAFRSYAFMTA